MSDCKHTFEHKPLLGDSVCIHCGFDPNEEPKQKPSEWIRERALAVRKMSPQQITGWDYQRDDNTFTPVELISALLDYLDAHPR